MKRWRAFLVVASINSTLALVYWVIVTYWPSIVPHGWAFGLTAFTSTSWSSPRSGWRGPGRRYRRMAADGPAGHRPADADELYSLAGLTAFAAICVVRHRRVRVVGHELRTADARVHVHRHRAGRRDALRALPASTPPQSISPATRRPIAGSASRARSVGLGVLLLCGLVAVLNFGPRSAGPVASGTETGDADAIGPRLVGREGRSRCRDATPGHVRPHPRRRPALLRRPVRPLQRGGATLLPRPPDRRGEVEVRGATTTCCRCSARRRSATAGCTAARGCTSTRTAACSASMPRPASRRGRSRSRPRATPRARRRS